MFERKETFFFQNKNVLFFFYFVSIISDLACNVLTLPGPQHIYTKFKGACLFLFVRLTQHNTQIQTNKQKKLDNFAFLFQSKI